MFYLYLVMPSVPWSSVPGPRSRGWEYKKQEDADKNFEGVVKQLATLGIPGVAAILETEGIEIRSEVIA